MGAECLVQTKGMLSANGAPTGNKQSTEGQARFALGVQQLQLLPAVLSPF